MELPLHVHSLVENEIIDPVLQSGEESLNLWVPVKWDLLCKYIMFVNELLVDKIAIKNASISVFYYLTDDNLVSGKAIYLYHKTTGHYINQCWPRIRCHVALISKLTCNVRKFRNVTLAVSYLVSPANQMCIQDTHTCFNQNMLQILWAANPEEHGLIHTEAQCGRKHAHGILCWPLVTQAVHDIVIHPHPSVEWERLKGDISLHHTELSYFQCVSTQDTAVFPNIKSICVYLSAAKTIILHKQPLVCFPFMFDQKL